jgi:hypothetical protein
MGILHDELKRAINALWTDASVMTELLRRILQKHGCSLSDVQLQSVVRAIGEGLDRDELSVDGYMESISISSDDIERAMHELEQKMGTDAEKIVTNAVEHLTPRILKSLYDALPEALREWHAAERSFEKRLRRRWKAGLNRLDMLISMAHEAGEMYVEELSRGFATDESSQTPPLMEVLTALHCRACLTAREIVCLLKAGYADGAHVRWRSLHELATTAFFLLEHRGDTPRRYFDHAAVERWRAAKQYQQHCHILGYEPFSDRELAEMERDSHAAISKYGAPFKEDYGWAAHVLGVPRPTFTQIEASLNMSHWRPYFRLACQSVHAGSQGLFFSLGLPRYSRTILLAGASDAGLADPGHQMAISLTMITVAFLTALPNLDGLVVCHCLLGLCNDIGKVLLRAHDSTNSAVSEVFTDRCAFRHID